ncbi:YihY/virulence factor BrkB family protein [Conexibacter stalactiti]|uniref:YihY/virulence factor BrkB family protein n=1 Tax=Conexibacter stalactiti TaxID=1940611 RepID=A0ABU4HSR8_9ACTN|nr:YihY/virulence factor BrkB family protein [Conexibacter stalactiti]MDW5596365.1 YihY/virulence factor BrkB family protein [Conexibacter stalactiti]MEC5037007.1 YihY/virulence factor BrkB family protein [Conexibacter stalactiti]
MDFLRPVRAFDQFQRRVPALGFPIAVVKKFSDDKAGHLAALIAYYGFFSIFPLLLVLVTVLGYVLAGNQEWYDTIVDSAVGQFPVIGEDIQIGALRGDTTALVIGIVAALWAGLGVTVAAQRAMDEVWDVPHRERRNFFTARARGLLVLVCLGGLNISITITVGLIVGGLGSFGVRASGLALTLLLDVFLFWAVFRLLTTREVPTRDLRIGIGLAAFGWAVLQTVGTIYVDRVVSRAGATYGFFAIVIGLLSWLYLGGQILLYAAEANVVRVRALWPRGLLDPVTAADVKAMRALARVEERTDDARVEMTFASSNAALQRSPAAAAAVAGQEDHERHDAEHEEDRVHDHAAGDGDYEQHDAKDQPQH